MSNFLPIEYFTKNSEARTAKISPDGKHLIAIFTYSGQEVFGVMNLAQKKVISLIAVRGAGGNIEDVNWVSNSRIVYSIYKTGKLDKTRRASGELYAVNIDGGRHDIIFGHRAGNVTHNAGIKVKKSSYADHRILNYLSDDERHILIAYYPWKVYGGYWRSNPQAKTLIKKLNVFSGRQTTIESLPISQATAIVDNNDVVRFSIGVNSNNRSVISYKKEKSSEWREFSLEKFEGTDLYPISFTKNNRSVYLSANVKNGTRALYLFDLETHKTKKLFHDETVDISRLILDFSQRRVVYVATENGLPNYYYLEPDNKKSLLHKNLRASFKGQDVEITSATKDGSKMIVYVSADNNPGDFYQFDTKSLNADYLMSRYKWIDRNKLVKSESIKFKSRDGLNIHGYLTRPKVEANVLLPLIVYPHGGPHGVRDEWGFQWSVQLLVNRGYAVLQVNYRGSSGFGKSFASAGYGNWGTLMQNDLTDATKLMIEQKIVDPSRICIYGASYGGYAALMGTVREPDLYRCAIGSVGVYDLPLMLKKGIISKYAKNGLAYLKEAIGDDIEDLKARSPVYNVEKIKAKVLLIHGKMDERVPIEQAFRLQEAFDGIRKEYQWLELKDEGHGYNDEENRRLVYKTIIKFLDENIGK